MSIGAQFSCGGLKPGRQPQGLRGESEAVAEASLGSGSCARSRDPDVTPVLSDPLWNKTILLDPHLGSAYIWGSTGAQSGVLKPWGGAGEVGPRAGWLVSLPWLVLLGSGAERGAV